MKKLKNFLLYLIRENPFAAVAMAVLAALSLNSGFRGTFYSNKVKAKQAQLEELGSTIDFNGKDYIGFICYTRNIVDASATRSTYRVPKDVYAIISDSADQTNEQVLTKLAGLRRPLLYTQSGVVKNCLEAWPSFRTFLMSKEIAIDGEEAKRVLREEAKTPSAQIVPLEINKQGQWAIDKRNEQERANSAVASR